MSNNLSCKRTLTTRKLLLYYKKHQIYSFPLFGSFRHPTIYPIQIGVVLTLSYSKSHCHASQLQLIMQRQSSVSSAATVPPARRFFYFSLKWLLLYFFLHFRQLQPLQCEDDSRCFDYPFKRILLYIFPHLQAATTVTIQTRSATLLLFPFKAFFTVFLSPISGSYNRYNSNTICIAFFISL